MDEFALIRKFFSRKSTSSAVIVPTGDDGAVLRATEGLDLVTVVDTLVADVHFPSSLRATDIGYRSLAVNLSDMAAMGARPRWSTLALTLDGVDIQWLDGFSRGLYEAADEYSVELVGGDTTSGTQIVITVQLIGEVERGAALTRGGAAKDEDIYVSGSLGDAAMGLKVLQSGTADSADARYLAGRFARPQARVAVGRAIRPLASAAIDLSDGLYADLAKLAAASGIGATIDVEKLPQSDEVQSLAGFGEARIHALSGGDDYELCFTAPRGQRAAVDAIAASLGTPITRIGQTGPGSGLKCVLEGDEIDYVDAGYSHF